MKKVIIFFTITLICSIFSINLDNISDVLNNYSKSINISNKVVSATETSIKYEDAQNMVKEVMKSYYMRGARYQYNYAKAIYGNIAPEEMTSQDPKYGVCAAFVYDVYSEAFGMQANDENTLFPKYNYYTIDQARDYYNDKDSKKDGNFLIYYEKDSESKRYVYSKGSEEIKSWEFAELIKPGDIFAFTGHVLVAYDVVTNPNTGKLDVLILNSTQDSVIKTRISSGVGTRPALHMFPTSKNSFLDVAEEGGIKFLWLSEYYRFIVDSKSQRLDCRTEECVVIRPFYEDKNGNAVFNYEINESNIKKSYLRTEYPGLFIEKTVSVGDNNNVYLNDTLTYTIKITNNSNVAPNSVTYEKFYIEEKLGSYVEYVSGSDGIIKSGNTLKWKISSLKAGTTKTLTYKVKVKNNISNINKTITSTGTFYSTTNNKNLITTGTVQNLIIPKLTQLEDTYANCYNTNKSSYSGIKLIDAVYDCATNQEFNLDSFDFEKLFVKASGLTSKATSKAINFKSSLDSKHSLFKKMIFNNYWSGLVTFKNESNEVKINLPRWSGINQKLRARTINSIDFKDGDILLYYIDYSTLNTPAEDKHTKENGLYAFIYLDGKFIGKNYNGKSNQRHEFTYEYYKNNSLDFEKHLFAGYSKLNSSNRDSILEFANYQTLYDKDYYVVLRPELVMKEPISIKVSTKPTKTQYIQNYEKLDLIGGVLTITNNDGSTKDVKLTDSQVIVSNFDNSTQGTKTLELKYNGLKTTLSVDIIAKEPSKIEIIQSPNKLTYIQNYEKLDLTGGKLKITYTDKTANTMDLNDKNINVKGFSNSKVGTNTITIEYANKTATLNVEIVKKSLTKIEVTAKPTKVEYLQNTEKLNLTGGILTLYYNDQTTSTLKLNDSKIITSGFNNSTIGKKTINVAYESKFASFEIEVVKSKPIKIEIATLPTKLTYIQKHDDLDLTGGTITVTYSDDSTKQIKMTDSSIKASGFDNSKKGTKTITIEYNGYKEQFKIEVISKKISKIEVTTKPNKIEYLQNVEKLDLTGGTLTIFYSDNTTSVLKLNDPKIKTKGFDNSEIGLNSITVEYGNYKTTFEVKIISKTVSSIGITKNPIKMQYVKNKESLDLTGGILTLYYNDNTQEEISLTDTKITISDFNNSEVGKNTIKINYEGKETTLDVEIIKSNVTFKLKVEPPLVFAIVCVLISVSCIIGYIAEKRKVFGRN